MPTLNPKILEWARSTAGLSFEEAAYAIGLGDAHGIPGPNRLEQPAHTRCLRHAEGELLRTMGPQQTPRLQNRLEGLTDMLSAVRTRVASPIVS